MTNLCEIECTVVSGLETVAQDEVEKKLGLEVFETIRGRVNFKIPFTRVREVIFCYKHVFIISEFLNELLKLIFQNVVSNNF